MQRRERFPGPIVGRGSPGHCPAQGLIPVRTSISAQGVERSKSSIVRHKPASLITAEARLLVVSRFTRAVVAVDGSKFKAVNNRDKRFAVANQTVDLAARSDNFNPAEIASSQFQHRLRQRREFAHRLLRLCCLAGCAMSLFTSKLSADRRKILGLLQRQRWDSILSRKRRLSHVCGAPKMCWRRIVQLQPETGRLKCARTFSGFVWLR